MHFVFHFSCKYAFCFLFQLQICILYYISAANMLGNLGPVSTHGNLIALGQVQIYSHPSSGLNVILAKTKFQTQNSPNLWVSFDKYV